MRYYSIKIDGASDVFPPRYDGGAQWGTLLNGRHDPNAQQIDFSLIVYRPSDAIDPASTLTIYGVPWEQVSQYANLVGKTITIMGGMSPGLPLATYQSRNAGLLLQGMIVTCWGNWIGTDTSIGMTIGTGGQTQASDSSPASPPSGGNAAPSSAAPAAQMRYNRTGPRSIDRITLPRVGSMISTNVGGRPSVAPRAGADFVSDIGSLSGGFGSATQTVGGMINNFFAGGGGLVAPLNFIHNLMPNMPLANAIRETLSKVFPNAQIKININPALKLAYQDAGMYQSFTQYAQFIKDLSHSILGTTGYQGVKMVMNGNKIKVFDQPDGGTVLSALDLIGQPTWIDQSHVNIACVLRAGLEAGNIVTLPQGILSSMEGTSAGANTPNQKSRLTFAGDFQIDQIHHVGDFRNPDGVQWSTHYICIPKGLLDNSPAQVAAKNVDQSTAAQNPAVTPAPQVPADITQISPMGRAAPQRPQDRLLRRSWSK